MDVVIIHLMIIVIIAGVFSTATTTEACVDLLPDRCDVKYCSYPVGASQCKKTCNICTVVTPTNATIKNRTTTATVTTTSTTITNGQTVNSTVSTSSVRISTALTSGSHSSKTSVLFVPGMLLWFLYRHLTELGS